MPVVALKPRRGYSFTDHATANPSVPPPGDRLDGEIDRLSAAIGQLIDFLAVSLNSDGSLKAQAAAKTAPPMARSSSQNNHGDSFIIAGADPTATALDWAETSWEWAEHMPDVIPPNILAWMGITGDHWSARWWANRALQIVSEHTGGLGVFLGENAPPAPAPGALWWCTADGQLYVFYQDISSSQWVPATTQLQAQAAVVLPPPPAAVIITPPAADEAAVRTPTVVTLTEIKPHYVDNPAVLAELTLRLPVAALGEGIDISFRRPVTALTLQTNAGAAIPDAPISAYGPGAGIQMRFDTPGWIYWK